ncbi:Chloride intracellular channel [Desmophyllum pertusum]|uniref:Chloride intracellular channel n=1 Tax=Desmophyllum pertusum TaxID=174260 RepID=A0A9W9Z0Q3_9CNID|nr:Chloride intracellular channel [Desmophyllum pertusum]
MALTVFVKGSNDHLKAHKELGDCPSSQRILMILRLKGVVFQTEYVDVTKKTRKNGRNLCEGRRGD